LDTSNIIYFKKDDEIDEDIQSNNTCLSLFTKTKRFKQDDSKTGPTASQVKNTKLKSCVCKNRNKRNIKTYRCLKNSSNYEVSRNVSYMSIHETHLSK